MTLKEHLNNQPRNEYNKTLARLAAAIDRSHAAIKTYLTGKVIPPAEVRKAINKHLKTSIDFDRANTEYISKRIKKDRARISTRTKLNTKQQAAV